jgi:NAD(P)-dependent dehydrogenase (short-subunit alcohol dehydrogenase family)
MAWIDGKRVVVTGATAGLGREIASQLASLGAHVVLGCRDGRRGEQVAASINAHIGAERATVMVVDASDQRSIGAFTDEYLATYGSLDVLVNNAGTVLADRQMSIDGIELTFATNVLGYFLITTRLLSALRAGAPSRVVNVASTWAYGVDFDDILFANRTYDGLAAYAQSKACDRMLTYAFARRLASDGITVNAVAPGLMLDTCLYRELSPTAKADLVQYGSRSIGAGADTPVWLASSPELHGVNGKFFEKRAEVRDEFRNDEAEERLWQRCEQFVLELERRR